MHHDRDADTLASLEIPVLDADLRQSAFVTTLKAEAALDCAVAPPIALNVGRRGASIELSEAC